MRLFRLEIKRVLKSRRTMILLAVAIVLSTLMAIIPIYYDSVNRPNEDGTVSELSGFESIQYKRDYYATTYGAVTPKKVADALRTYQDCVTEYGGEENIPLDVNVSRLLAIRPLLRGLPEAYADPYTGMAADLMEIDPNDAEETYYEKCSSHLKDIMRMEQKKHPAAQENASELYAEVETPFMLYAGFSRDTFDYIELYIMLLTILCIAMTAPLFSGEYQTGADSILRCTKFGRTELAGIKITASISIFAIIYALCIGIQLLIINFAFGFDCLKTSIQMLYSVISLPNINMGQTEMLLATGGLLSVLACISCTMFISANCKDSLTSMLISIVILFIPLFAYVAFDATWLSSILPSAGIGIQNNLLYQLIDFNYLHIGDMSFWTPYVILISSVIEIPLFLMLTAYSYNKHQVA